jgi:radical SAM superfamily enzyme YgiQ (UPF0313 family)
VSQKGEVSLSSLRVDAITPALIQCLREGKDRTVAIAPEAGSERLRKVLKKGYTDEEILRAVDTLIENGLFQFKCYFLIGLPSETDEDVKEILLLTKRIRHHLLSNRKSRKENWKVVLSVNPFVPKPATPFQWAPLEEVNALKRKLKILQRGVRGERGVEVILAFLNGPIFSLACRGSQSRKDLNGRSSIQEIERALRGGYQPILCLSAKTLRKPSLGFITMEYPKRGLGRNTSGPWRTHSITR